MSVIRAIQSIGRLYPRLQRSSIFSSSRGYLGSTFRAADEWGKVRKVEQRPAAVPVAEQEQDDDQSEQEREGVRQILKKIVPDPNILNHLDQHKLGYLTTRRTRRRVAIKFDSLEEMNKNGEKTSIAYHRSKAPFPFDEIGKALFKLKEVDYSKIILESSPPQIALIGRSNVGKSTLINALVGFDKSYVQKAAVSDKPGETRELSLYQLGQVRNPHYIKPPQKPLRGKNHFAPPPALEERDFEEDEGKFRHLSHLPGLVVADMPGYGFAFMNEEEKERCNRLYTEYLFDSQFITNCPIKRVFILVDARHGLKKTDIAFLQHLEKTYQSYRDRYLSKKAKEQNPIGENEEKIDTSIIHKEYPKTLSWKLQFIMTKSDLVERIELCKRIQYLKQQINENVSSYFMNELPIIVLSGKDYSGLYILQKELSLLITNPIVREFRNNVMKWKKEREEKRLLAKYSKNDSSYDDRKDEDEKAGRKGKWTDKERDGKKEKKIIKKDGQKKDADKETKSRNRKHDDESDVYQRKIRFRINEEERNDDKFERNSPKGKINPSRSPRKEKMVEKANEYRFEDDIAFEQFGGAKKKETKIKPSFKNVKPRNQRKTKRDDETEDLYAYDGPGVDFDDDSDSIDYKFDDYSTPVTKKAQTKIAHVFKERSNEDLKTSSIEKDEGGGRRRRSSLTLKKRKPTSIDQ